MTSFTYLVHFLLMLTAILVELVTLTIDAQRVAMVFMWVPISSLGRQRNNFWFPNLVLKLNIDALFFSQHKCIGCACSCVS